MSTTPKRCAERSTLISITRGRRRDSIRTENVKNASAYIISRPPISRNIGRKLQSLRYRKIEVSLYVVDGSDLATIPGVSFGAK
jgi:hypothetical protein